jgi:hypothetical protein
LIHPSQNALIELVAYCITFGSSQAATTALFHNCSTSELLHLYATFAATLKYSYLLHYIAAARYEDTLLLKLLFSSFAADFTSTNAAHFW